MLFFCSCVISATKNVFVKNFKYIYEAINDVLGKQKLVLKTHLFIKIVKYFAFFTEASSV